MRMQATKPSCLPQEQIPARKFPFHQSDSVFTYANAVRFCGQDEEHDPGEEFEEWLACAVCGDNGTSHPCEY